MSARRRLAIGLLGALISVLSTPAKAASNYDPSIEYLTLETPHFYVVHARGYEPIAIRTGLIAESILPRLSKKYGYELSGKVSIVLDDQVDAANGSATILPSKTVTLFITPPTETSGLEDYDDWLESILIHELTHIFHLDMVYGLPWLGRQIFGKYVALNQYTPGWVTEGLAVYGETVGTGAGRGRSSYVDMVLRMAALDDRFPSIDQGFRGLSHWPFSNVAYFFGGRFHQYLAERFGESAMVHYHQAYAATPVPFLTWLAAEIAFDSTLESLWGDFEDRIGEEAMETLEKVRTSSLGETRPTRLTFVGGDLSGPRITPDGRFIIFSTYSPVDGARVRRIPIQGGDSEVLENDTFSKGFSFSPDGKAFYFQQTEINQRYYAHNSILRYDLATKETNRIRLGLDKDGTGPELLGFMAPSGSLRGRDPDVSRQGNQIVFVQTPFASNRLVLAWLESDGLTIHPEIILPAEADVQLSNPRFAPNGQRIAVSRFRGGRRDIILIDLHGRVVDEITRDRAQDVDPSFSPDGRWLVFSSDRSGIYNLYAYDLANKTFRQLTNVISGAYQPSVSPDGKTLVFRGYSSDGFDVYSIPFDPEATPPTDFVKSATTALDRTTRRPPSLQADVKEPPAPADLRIDEPVNVNRNLDLRPKISRAPLAIPDGFELRPYSSLDTLLPFRDNWNLFPLIATNEGEIYGQLSHFGRDPLGKHAYSLWVTYGTDTEFVGGGAAYSNDQFEPTFSVGASASARSFSLRDQDGAVFADYDERSLLASVSIGLPILARHYFSIGYSFEDRRSLHDLSSDVTSRAARLPADGHFARVSMGYTYDNTRSFPRSISLERGYSLGLGISGLSKGVGSDYEQVVASGEFRGYITMPWEAAWLRNHVLAARVSLSVGGGPDLAERFRLGGVAGRSLLTTTTSNFVPLRGLLTAGLDGTAVIGGTLEYRAPILWVERGLGTFPAVVRNFHLALFSDAGRVFETLDLDELSTDPLGQLAVSVGGELRADVLLWHNLGLEARLGYAQVLTTPYASILDKSGAYFSLGSPF